MHSANCLEEETAIPSVDLRPDELEDPSWDAVERILVRTEGEDVVQRPEERIPCLVLEVDVSARRTRCLKGGEPLDTLAGRNVMAESQLDAAAA